MARMTVTIEVDLLEDDADCDKLAGQMLDDLQQQYPYLDLGVIEVEGPNCL
uniref:Uncharacterized protein n=1 Tax=Pseudomonas phage Ulitu01 TaxID=3138550 RepID=A0AAU6W0W6_9CAUD